MSLQDSMKLEDVIIALNKSSYNHKYYYFSCKGFMVTNDANEYVKFLTQKDISDKILSNGLLTESMTV